MLVCRRFGQKAIMEMTTMLHALIHLALHGAVQERGILTLYNFIHTHTQRKPIVLLHRSPACQSDQAFKMARAQFLPAAPMTPPPGWAPEPQRYKPIGDKIEVGFSTGVK